MPSLGVAWVNGLSNFEKNMFSVLPGIPFLITFVILYSKEKLCHYPLRILIA